MQVQRRLNRCGITRFDVFSKVFVLEEKGRAKGRAICKYRHFVVRYRLTENQVSHFTNRSLKSDGLSTILEGIKPFLLT